MMFLTKVEFSPRAEKESKRLPAHVLSKLLRWVDAVEYYGLEVVKRVPGYHDEPLKGQRWGQRSIRLSRSYRAIYEIVSQGTIRKVLIKEVNKHAY